MIPKRVVIYPYDINSESAHQFKHALDGLIVRREGKYQPKSGDFIIGWGNSKTPIWADKAKALQLPIINPWEGLQRAVHKRHTFDALAAQGVPTVPFTTSSWVAQQWLDADHTVVGRNRLTGNKGNGIIIIKPHDPVPELPLYTQFQPTCHEFRVHVAHQRVIDFQQKKRKNGVEHDPYVRSEENGYVFCRKGVRLPPSVGEVAVQAVRAIGLDFGGIDMLYNPKKDKPMVLEINSAPGVVEHYGTEAYVDAFKLYMNNAV